MTLVIWKWSQMYRKHRDKCQWECSGVTCGPVYKSGLLSVHQRFRFYTTFGDSLMANSDSRTALVVLSGVALYHEDLRFVNLGGPVHEVINTVWFVDLCQWQTARFFFGPVYELELFIVCIPETLHHCISDIWQQLREYRHYVVSNCGLCTL
jgi:hypothetical protein